MKKQTYKLKFGKAGIGILVSNLNQLDSADHPVTIAYIYGPESIRYYKKVPDYVKKRITNYSKVKDNYIKGRFK
jgi:hypothetical protein